MPHVDEPSVEKPECLVARSTFTARASMADSMGNSWTEVLWLLVVVLVDVVSSFDNLFPLQ